MEPQAGKSFYWEKNKTKGLHFASSQPSQEAVQSQTQGLDIQQATEGTGFCCKESGAAARKEGVHRTRAHQAQAP